MRIEGNFSSPYTGRNGAAADDPVSDQLRKQIQEVKKQLQELSADKSAAPQEKAEQQKELTKKLNDLNSQLRQHELDQQKEQREKAIEKQKERQEAAKASDGKGKKEAGFDKKTVQAMAAADTAQAVTVEKEGVRMDLSHEALALEIAIKQEEWEGGVSPLRTDLADVYGKLGKVTGEIVGDLAEASGTLTKAVQNAGQVDSTAPEDSGEEPAQDKVLRNKELQDEDLQNKDLQNEDPQYNSPQNEKENPRTALL